MSESLFQFGDFGSHSGLVLPFKINCSALTDEDIASIAEVAARGFRYSGVLGIDPVGVRLADALGRHPLLDPEARRILIVNDILTSDAPFEEARQSILGESPDHRVSGFVIFARRRPPAWVTPMFRLGAKWR